MRLIWLGLIIGCFSIASACAQERPANGQAADYAKGWIRLFDGETTFGWTPRGEAKWSIADGAVQANEGGKGMLCTNTEFANYELAAECWIDDKANSGIFLRCPVEGEVNGENAYEVNVYDKHKDWPTGSINNIAKTKTRVRSVGKWTNWLIRAEGDHLTITVDGRKTLDIRNALHARGVIGLQYNGEGTVRFRNIRLRPLSLKSIFNGKDLTGWNVLPGHRSVYSVTPEGWMNVKNGGGEIQSEGQYGDFVLQLDIFSNGDRLNSGVFFREDPGAFWGGYESQIRNQWQGDDRTKPVDFGTGGIYNQQPARKVVSSDREWFTMTVVAAGKHLAVWVNGYQVSDFTDMRPENASARAGSRTKAGCIGLQGHDPTTDLSFRNINVVELPAAK